MTHLHLYKALHLQEISIFNAVKNHKMNLNRLMIILILGAVMSCSEQKPQITKTWFKGNLHTHSYWSDGDDFPEEIMDWYKSNGYQFVALSDHNTLAEGERWKVIPEDSIYQMAFTAYLEKYGSDWVNYRTDSLDRTHVRLKTYDEYRGRFEENEKFMIIQSEEITDRYGDKPLHLNATNIQKLIAPQGGNSVAEVLQNNIDAVIRQREALNVPMMVHINHPNFGHAVKLEDMIALKNERFFEVYNGHPAVHNSADSTHLSTEDMWDMINIAYLENNKPMMFGIATDDSHHYHVKGSKWSNAGRGWVMVQSDSLNPKSIIEAMEQGSFYASTGVELKALSYKNQKLSVEVQAEKDIEYQITFIGCKKGKNEPETFLVHKGNKASFEVSDDMLFVRCKINSTKLQDNPIENLLYETAWTQPVN
jgi:hypothetical protein